MKPKVHIVGAGFSGLTMAYFLVKLDFAVTIYEKDCVGGLIRTSSTPYGPAETAANGFLASALLEAVAADIQVPLQSANKESRRRFIFREHLRRWPIGLLASAKLLLFIIRFFCCKKSVRPRPQESISAWGQRLLGLEASKYLLSPALQGIYAGDPEQMSASLLLQPLWQKKMARGQLRGTVAPAGGMKDFIQGLQYFLQKHGVEFLLEATPEKISTPLVIATDLSAASTWAETIDAGMAREMRQLPQAPLLTATVFWPDSVPKIKGFGVLFPRDQSVRALGVLANSQIFAGRGLHSESWIYGGALDLQAATMQKKELLEQIQKDRAVLFTGDHTPLELTYQAWPRALPHYTLALENFLQRWNGEFPRQQTFFTGNYWGTLGLSRILERNQKLAERMNACL